jgi:hypothetical protein
LAGADLMKAECPCPINIAASRRTRYQTPDFAKSATLDILENYSTGKK